MDFYLIDLISVFLETYTCYVFFNAIGEKRKHKFLIVINYLIFIFSMATLYYYEDNNIIKIAFLFVYCFILSLSNKIDKKFRWLSVLILFIIINAVELVVGFFMSLIFSTTVEIIKNSILYYTVGVLASKSITILIVKLIQFKYKSNEINLPKSVILLFSIFPIITLGVGILLIGVFGVDINPKYAGVGVISELLLIIANITVFYLFEIYAKKNNEEYFLKIEQESLKLQTKYLEEKIDKQIVSSKEMHDLKNKLFAIKNMLENNYTDGINKIDEVCEIVQGMQNITYTSNNAIDSLINSKKRTIDANNINFKCECYVCGFENYKEIDLCALIGNLLDNSIEACLNIKDRIIKLYFKQVDEYLNIIIKNTYSKDMVIQDFKTSKNNKYLHGFGLLNVETICKSYNGSIKIYQNDYFEVSVLLRNNATYVKKNVV